MDTIKKYATQYYSCLKKVYYRHNPQECRKLFDLENDFQVFTPLSKYNINLIKDHLVERRHPVNNETLMYPTRLHVLINKNKATQLQFNDGNGLCVKKNKSGTSELKKQLIEKDIYSDVPIKLNDCRPLECSWLTSESIQYSQDLKESAKSSGNIFGGNGLLLIESCLLQNPPEFALCEIEKDYEFKNFFNGITTFKFNEKSPCFSFPSDGVGATYYYDNKNNDYIKSYILDIEGANGLFVETHPFPHIFTPSDHDSVAKVLLCKKCSGAYYFSFLILKYGEALFLPENTIHSDSSSVGSLFVAFTAGSKADTVLVKDQQSFSMVNLYP